MPVIVPFGFDDNEAFMLPLAIEGLIEGTEYAENDDITIVPKEIPSMKVMSRSGDKFLFVFGSDGWMAKYEADLIKRLSPHYEVLVVPSRYYPKI